MCHYFKVETHCTDEIIATCSLLDTNLDGLLFTMYYWFLQFWTVLYKLLQWKASAAFYPAHPQIRAGGVRDGGNRGEVHTTSRLFQIVMLCKCFYITYVKLFYPCWRFSGSQCHSSTIRSSVTWWRRNIEASYQYWYVEWIQADIYDMIKSAFSLSSVVWSDWRQENA